MGTDDFPDSENEKIDSDWLLTPIVASLIPSLEKELQQVTVGEMGIPDTHPAALQSRSVNSLENSDSIIGSLSLSGSASTKSRSVTPTRKSSLQAKVKPSRAPTPTSHNTLPSTTASAKPPVRTSNPKESTAFLTTPIARPTVLSSRSTSRSAIPTRPSATLSTASAPSHRSSLVKKSAPSHGFSSMVRSKTWKASEVPGFSLDTPPNSKTSVLERPASTSRIRPGAPGAETALSGTVIGGGTKQRVCSSSRGEARHGSSVPSNRSSLLVKSRAQCDNSDHVNPVLIGTQMVERVVNMRKLAPPKLEDNCYSQVMTAERSSSSLNSSGFGRTLSKTSLDMALRHMDIGRAMSGSLRPSITK